ncbi:hypothetical protein ACHAW6_012784 [Cyclotella cf. meneghiniana]
MMRNTRAAEAAAAVLFFLMVTYTQNLKISSLAPSLAEEVARLVKVEDKSFNVINRPQAHISWECLQESDVRDTINSTENIIVVMPAKAAGTSLKNFAKSCNPNTSENLQTLLRSNDALNLLTKSWDMPGVYASHYWVPQALSQLLRSVSHHTLVIYIHREETSRFTSAAHHVLTQWCLHGPPKAHKKFFNKVESSKRKCHVHEAKLVETLKIRPQEMGMGTVELLTCTTYSSIEEYAPNMLFVDYKHADVLQNLMAEKYCPKLMNHSHHIGKGSEYVFVQLQNGGIEVSLSDWLEKKSSYLEWMMSLNDKVSCLVKTRRMEDNLSSCAGDFLNAKAVLND